MNKKWYWTIGSIVLLGVSYFFRQKGIDLWKQAMDRRRTITVTAG